MSALRIFASAFIITLAIMAMLLVATAGNAQPSQCAGTADLRAALAVKCGEAPIWVGICGPAQCVLFGNADTQTWTLVRVDGDVGCLFQSGTGYAAGPELAPPPPVGEEG